MLIASPVPVCKMCIRDSYNTYYEDEQGDQYYNDGSAFAGLGSGSNNYAPSNPALTERVEADIQACLLYTSSGTAFRFALPLASSQEGR